MHCGSKVRRYLYWEFDVYFLFSRAVVNIPIQTLITPPWLLLREIIISQLELGRLELSLAPRRLGVRDASPCSFRRDLFRLSSSNSFNVWLLRLGFFLVLTQGLLSFLTLLIFSVTPTIITCNGHTKICMRPILPRMFCRKKHQRSHSCCALQLAFHTWAAHFAKSTIFTLRWQRDLFQVTKIHLNNTI